MIYLTRHGESVWNAEHRYQGNAPVELSEKGILQSQRLAEALVGKGITEIYTSPIRRCAQTAEIVAQRLNVPVHEMAGLREWEISRRLWGEKDLKDKFPKEDWERFRSDPSFHFPDGESLEQVIQRTMEAFQQIPHDEKHTPLIVAHQANVQIILLETTVGLNLNGNPLHAISRLWIDNCSVNILGEKYGLFRLIAMNDTCHLDGTL